MSSEDKVIAPIDGEIHIDIRVDKDSEKPEEPSQEKPQIREVFMIFRKIG